MLGRKRKRPTDATRPDLPITPMLDMSFQLLAFFVLTYRPTPMEAQMALALPPAEAGPVAVAPPPAELQLPDDEDLTIQVYDGPGGGVDHIVVARVTGDVTLRDTSALFTFLKETVTRRPGKPPKVTLEIAPDLNYQFVVKMIDEARRAGIQSISPTMIRARP